MNRVRPLFLLALAGLAPGAAQAIDYCPQNDSEFASALFFSQFAGPIRILLGAGKTYHLAGTAYENTPYRPLGLTLEGGYDATCDNQITQDAASSVLDGTGANGGYPTAHSTTSDGSFTLRTLTITHLPKDLQISVAGDGARLSLQHVRVVDGHSIGLYADGDDVRISVNDSVFARLNDSVLDTAIELSSQFYDGVRIDLVNSTVTGNAQNGVTIHDPSGSSWLYNNILWGNTGLDLAQDEPVWAFYNTIGSHDGGFLGGSQGNLSSNPLFVSATNYNLQAGSPALNSGTSSVPGGLSAYDVEGGPRQVDTKVDRGAYEKDTSGTILIVNSTFDGPGTCPSPSGCTLRQAILEANANPSFNIIGFNISGSCPRTITLSSALPAITDALRISGYTQPGSSQNSSDLQDNAVPCVELVDGAGITNGLRFAPAADGDSFEVSGLAIGGFATGIFLNNTLSGTHNEFDIWGNFIGLAADGSTSRPNTTFGIDVNGPSYGSVGGSDVARRNVIAGAAVGVRLSGDNSAYDYSSVANNYIGTAESGNVARPNGVGVFVNSGLNRITDNLVSGNTGSGIQLSGSSAQNNAVTYNRIGVKALALCVPPCTPDYDLGNGGSGVTVGATFNRIASNTIAYNGGDGVAVTGGNYNNISANAMYANTGLGIDLGPDGVNPNDNDSAAASTANEGRNYPVLGTAFGGNRSGKVTGTLGSVNGDFTLNFYASDSCDASGHGEGRYFLGSAKVTISNATAGNDGQVIFVLPLNNAPVNLPGKAITATAARYGSAQSTSEFSACITYQYDDTIFADGFEQQPPP